PARLAVRPHNAVLALELAARPEGGVDRCTKALEILGVDRLLESAEVDPLPASVSADLPSALAHPDLVPFDVEVPENGVRGFGRERHPLLALAQLGVGDLKPARELRGPDDVEGE